MSSKKDRKAQRQEAAIREQRRRWYETAAASPLSRHQLDSLLDYLAEQIVANGHDDTLRYTQQWLGTNGLPVEETLEFLVRHRFRSDFEVALNADPNALFGPTDDRIARMPIPEEALEALIEWVDQKVQINGCDHSSRFARQWLTDNGYPLAPTEFALLAQGGGCDCEIVLNLESANIYPTTNRRIT